MKTTCMEDCRYLTAEEAMAIGLKAWLEAGRLCDHTRPEGQPWIDEDGMEWCGQEDFAHYFREQLVDKAAALESERLRPGESADTMAESGGSGDEEFAGRPEGAGNHA